MVVGGCTWKRWVCKGRSACVCGGVVWVCTRGGCGGADRDGRGGAAWQGLESYTYINVSMCVAGCKWVYGRTAWPVGSI